MFTIIYRAGIFGGILLDFCSHENAFLHVQVSRHRRQLRLSAVCRHCALSLINCSPCLFAACRCCQSFWTYRCRSSLMFSMSRSTATPGSHPSSTSQAGLLVERWCDTSRACIAGVSTSSPIEWPNHFILPTLMHSLHGVTHVRSIAHCCLIVYCQLIWSIPLRRFQWKTSIVVSVVKSKLRCRAWGETRCKHWTAGSRILVPMQVSPFYC